MCTTYTNAFQELWLNNIQDSLVRVTSSFPLFRLEAYNRNDNFSGSSDLVTDKNDFKMTLPAHTCFKDVTSSALPSVNHLTIREAIAYLDLSGSTLASGHRLYDSRFLRFLRWAQDGNMTCYTGQCRAEMRRTVCYNTHIKIDTNGEVMETECECPAGMGPNAHCKHVQAVLLAVIDYTGGEQPNLELSCTEVLQSFHKPRRLHNGSPAKASTLKVTKQPLALNFDPRPQKYRKLACYPAHVKSLTLNYAANTHNQVPLLQTIGPANIYAVDKDHDYLIKPQSQMFLDQSNITKISRETADDIEYRTRLQNKSVEWKKERRNRMQSSRFGVIIKCVSQHAKERIAREMIDGNEFVSRATSHGNRLEPDAITCYEQLCDVKVQKCGLVISIDKPYLASSPDGLVNEDTVLEVKCPYCARNMLITPHTVPYLIQDGSEMRLNPNHQYYAQVQAQMYMTGRTKCHFVVHTFKDTKVCNVPVDNVFIQDMLRTLDDYFENVFKKVYLARHFYKDL
ncbi:PREDICTED: uncharacterized protein LOC106815860 [Priapulus caudatus]|uniref:Uncharacterized protein LOC106815860 n=1 Tax=Priapulus caudatus TaxID=37621 RepID=A0ABM1EUJ8_PRICU|nr:PREDICTED: uncharacterized protein LOC106815860 [Priapulus caudatus]